MLATKHPPLSVLQLEINEAEKYFLEKLIAQGKLPTLARMVAQGCLLQTKVPGWDAGREKAWRSISPWIVWPSIYSGLAPQDHGLVGFGQDTSSIQGKCVWDVLDREGVSVGLFGNLMSYPPRNSGAASFYVPEALADDAACFPPKARPAQELCVFTARNYSEAFHRTAFKAGRLLLSSMKSGVRASTVLRTLRQVPAEAIVGPSFEPERAMLASYIAVDAFKPLYTRFQPRFSSLHLNHVAYMQHRYWRASEPERFSDELSPTDRRFFRDVVARKTYERRFERWIERSFEYTDRVLAELIAAAPAGTIVCVATGLGVRPFDPVSEIHNPVVRLVRERELFDAIGLSGYTVLHQMNPDVTVNFQDERAAAQAAERIAGLHVFEGEELFAVQRRGHQVFLELNMPLRRGDEPLPKIRHGALPEFSADFSRHIREHRSPDQSTAHHKDAGWWLVWSNDRELQARAKIIPVTDIAPTILSWFGIAPQPWHKPVHAPAIALVP
jgi:hypothetical protein